MAQSRFLSFAHGRLQRWPSPSVGLESLKGVVLMLLCTPCDGINRIWWLWWLQVIEFNTWHDVFLAKDCRTCGYSLANAAGQTYWVVEPKAFNYEAFNLKPLPNEVLGIVAGHLDGLKP